MSGCMGCLVAWLADWLFDLLVGCTIHQVGCRKSVKLGIKTIKLEPKIVKHSCQEASWRGLGGSWEGLSHILAARDVQEAKKSPDGPQMEPQVGAENRSKIDLGAIQKLIIFLIDFWVDF